MKRRDFTKAIAGIAAGVVAGTKVFAQAPKPAEKPKEIKHDCKGKNECKGQGGCNTGDGGCAGKNSCKGKGGCAMPKKAEPAPSKK